MHLLCKTPLYNRPIQQKRLQCLNIIAEIRCRQWRECIWVERAVLMMMMMMMMMVMMIAEWRVHSEARSVVQCVRSVWNALRSSQRAQTLVRFKALATPPVQVGIRNAWPRHLIDPYFCPLYQLAPRSLRESAAGYPVIRLGLNERALDGAARARTRTSLSVQFSSAQHGTRRNNTLSPCQSFCSCLCMVIIYTVLHG
ncbi:hypothetical protein PGIGA_G00204220 [Pangasianodon gigas]|uniref:Uncharacterized protein n=1 Tax=Pangasianodon gigas TaxID=30993 RepID=A0ACC5WFU1_PANGG|nr:hypothetical protein [Pangasianodon gigas]